MILSLEDHKKRLLRFKKKHLINNLNASLETFEELSFHGDDIDMWRELKNYTISLINDLNSKTSLNS